MKLDDALELYQRLKSASNRRARTISRRNWRLIEKHRAGRRRRAGARSGQKYDQAAFNIFLDFHGQLQRPVEIMRYRSWCRRPGRHARRLAKHRHQPDGKRAHGDRSQPGGNGLRRDGHGLAPRTSPPTSTRPWRIIASGSATGLRRKLNKAGEEFFFNAFEPFYKAMVIYVLALLLALAAGSAGDQIVRNAAALGVLADRRWRVSSTPSAWSSACIWKAGRR